MFVHVLLLTPEILLQETSCLMMSCFYADPKGIAIHNLDGGLVPRAGQTLGLGVEGD